MAPEKEPQKKDALPVLSIDQRAELARMLPEIQKDMEILLRALYRFEKNYPDEFKEFKVSHPQFMADYEMVKLFFVGLNSFSLPEKDIRNYIDKYNIYAARVNRVLWRILENTPVVLPPSANEYINALANGEVEFEEQLLKEIDPQELKKIADELWSDLFPDSYTDRFVKWATDQEKLEGYQKILLAPANGIEAVIGGFVSLLNIKTYKDFSRAIETMCKMSVKEWCACWKTLKVMYDKIDSSTKAAQILSIIVGIAFLFGGIKKFMQIINKLGKGKEILSSALFAADMSMMTTRYVGKAKVLPAAVIGGISLRYIEWNRSRS